MSLRGFAVAFAVQEFHRHQSVEEIADAPRIQANFCAESAPVIRRLPSFVKTSNPTAVSKTLEDQNAKAVWRMAVGSGCAFMLCMALINSANMG